MSLASCQTAPPRDSEDRLLSGAVQEVKVLTTSSRGTLEHRTCRAGRQEHVEDGSASGRALDADPSPVRGDDPVRDREPKTRPATDVLGGEEGLEDATEAIGRDSRSIVTDRDARIAVVHARADPDVAARGRGIA